MYVLLITRLLRLVGRWARKPVNHTSWVAVVTPTDRPKSVRNRCVIELFCGVVYVVTLPFWHFCWCMGFCHRTESDLFLFLFLRRREIYTLSHFTREFFSLIIFKEYAFRIVYRTESCALIGCIYVFHCKWNGSKEEATQNSLYRYTIFWRNHNANVTLASKLALPKYRHKT